jgi:acetyl esterase/lipase
MRRSVLVVAVAVAVIGLSGCYPDLTPPGAAPLRYRDQVFSGVDVTSNIVYGRSTNQDGSTEVLRLDMYAPRGDTNTLRPAIVWVHGGSFCCGDKTSGEIVDEATTFAMKGYVNVSINYRLYPPGCSASNPSSTGCIQAIRDATYDAQGAVRFLRANFETYGVDPFRIAMGGSSAGGIVAMDAAYNSEEPGNSGHPHNASTVRAAVALSGAHIFGSMGPGDAPTLLFHGTADRTVPYAWAEATANDAHAAGLDSFLETWDGDGHVPYEEHRTQIIDQTTNFLYWEMALPDAAG